MNKEELIKAVDCREHWEAIDDVINEALDGFAIVPVEPTEAMIVGFWGEIMHGEHERDAAKEAYAEMLSASQQGEG
jgi:hypothetical protein